MGIPRCIALICLTAAVGTARADGLDGERFVPSVGAAGTFVNEHPAVASHLGFGLGLFLNYADDPIVLRDSTGGIGAKPLHTALTTDLTASLGLFGWAELGIGVPLHLVYDGDTYTAGTARLDANAGIGDLRLVPKFALLRRGDLDRHLVLGVAAPVSVPTGNDEAVRGAGGVSVTPELLLAGHLGKLGLGFDVGFRWRSQRPADLPWGDEVTLGPWVSVEVIKDLTLRLEGYAEKSVGSHTALASGADFPFEVLGGVDYAIGDWDIYAGASRGVTDGIGNPTLRLIGGVRFRQDAPRHEGFEDSDGDGIPDKDDKCRNEPEDQDGFEDSDGCPDRDNDEDGIPDVDDECPDLRGDLAHDGCPSNTFVKIEDGKVYIFGKVQFAVNSSRIDGRSEQLLDQIAQALKANQSVRTLRIEGYTDTVGDPGFNLRLSEERADAVRDALIRRGVDGDRLTTRGYGEDNPIAPNQSPGGRARNRRVEFIITGDRK